MPFVHEINFPVRHYECDPYGHVNHANYLRYMQEAAFSASAAVGYGAQRYDELGYHWFAYETDLEYLASLVYGDTVTVKTWVEDFRRVRSLRQYELYREDKMIARAATDWVLIDTKTMMPTTIPPEIVEAYARDDDVTQAPRQTPLPFMRQPETGAFTMRRRVEWRDLDPAGHVNNAVYLHFIADCGMQCARHYHWSMEQTRERGYAKVARRHFIEYKAAAHVDDELEITTWMTDMRRASAVRHYIITRPADNKLIARVRTLGVWLDLNTRQPARIPDAYREAFAANIVD